MKEVAEEAGDHTNVSPDPLQTPLAVHPSSVSTICFLHSCQTSLCIASDRHLMAFCIAQLKPGILTLLQGPAPLPDVTPAPVPSPLGSGHTDQLPASSEAAPVSGHLHYGSRRQARHGPHRSSPWLYHHWPNVSMPETLLT